MKFLLALSFCIYSISMFSQETASIEYSPDVDFNWSMFKGKINPHQVATLGKNTGAVTVSSLTYKTSVLGKLALIKVSALFLPFESWTRYPKLENADEALLHEKRHFDICEIFARKLRQAIIMNHFSKSRFSTSMETLFNKITQEYQLEQEKYDRETQHSLDPVQQQRWSKMIDAELSTLSAYANPTVKISLY